MKKYFVCLQNKQIYLLLLGENFLKETSISLDYIGLYGREKCTTFIMQLFKIHFLLSSVFLRSQKHE